MLWVIDGLIYGFFMAVYLLFNQHFKIDGYVLGIWRGFGICALFLPFVFCFTMPTDIGYWGLLIAQGYCIGVYDSHIFFASAKYGAGPTSRFMAVTVLLTTFIWWFLTPKEFWLLLHNGDALVTLILILCGFSFCYWQMLQSKVSRQVAGAMLPAVAALAAMSVMTKYIALGGRTVWQALAYYLTVSTFVSGCYNLFWYLYRRRRYQVKTPIFSRAMLKIGILLVLFSTLLIVAKTMALRLAVNPGYVTALLLVVPLFTMALNRHYKVADKVSVEAGTAMIFFLSLLVALVYGGQVTD